MKYIPIYLEMRPDKVPKPVLINERIALRYNLKRGDTVTGALAIKVDTDVLYEELLGIQTECNPQAEGKDE